MIKECLNTENTIDDGMFFLNKGFARMESVCVLRLGFRFLMKSIL